MIKRRFYRAERGDKDDGSSDSSSDSEPEVRSSDNDSDDEQPNPEPAPESEPASNVEADNNDDDHDDNDDDDDDDDNRSILKSQQPSSSSSGYESEDSSANEIEADSGGLLANDDDSGSGKDGDQPKESLFPRKENGEIMETQDKDNPVNDLPKCVLQSKSVYKCRLCPKIVCLNEESLRTHLKSKRHSRSEKLLKEGRLKRVLNSDGEEEVMSDDDGETHAERHARIMAIAQDTSKKKSRGRQRQRNRLKRKKQKSSSNTPNSGQQTQNRAKRRKKNAD